MIRIDMSEYMEKTQRRPAHRRAPGYVGFEEGGQLSEAVRRKPYSVVSSTEIEKAHHDVFNVSCKSSRRPHHRRPGPAPSDFKNTVIIMTSNLGSQYILEAADNPEQREAASSKLCAATSVPSSSPHRRGRDLDRLADEDLREDRRDSDRTTRQTPRAQKLTLKLTDAAKIELAHEGYDPVYGARPLKTRRPTIRSSTRSRSRSSPDDSAKETRSRPM